PHVLFRSSAIDGNYGRLALAPLDDPAGPRAVTGLQCERVSVAAGRGVCLAADRGFLTTYRAVTFGPDFRPVHELRLAGSPSRVRVSPDGGLAAVTVFVTGHSYAAEGFSTATTLLDLRTGAELGNLEEFAVSRDGQRFWSQDFNFWGVTFTGDGHRFYATLATGGQTHLVEGDVAARSARVLRDNVECPSLSPDGTRLVFKKRVGPDGPVTWRLHLLELDTMRETPLAETRNVDDQAEWLDDGQVLYALPRDPRTPTAATDTWAVAVEGRAAPRLFLAHGDSPAVVR
ncbi:MAG: hypothetical protein M3N52_06570, partial [Actinomycetota bacterium]|nr:hypothetical protein [Actinomycetota bacterium]